MPTARILLRLLRKTYFPPKGSLASRSARRRLLMTAFLPPFLLALAVHRLGLFLDDWLFPTYRDVVVKEPVFVLGVPRSGTTLLQHVLAGDAAQFSAISGWEVVLAPSITERRFFQLVGAIDRRLGGLGRRWVERAEKRLFRSMRNVHRLSLFQPEEDDFLLFSILGGTYLLVPFPFLEELEHLLYFDERTPPEEQRRILSFYRGCVQRHLYVHGREKRFLSKNPTFTPKLRALREHFPDAKIVYCTRSPHQVVPSTMSLLSIPWRAFGNEGGATFREIQMGFLAHWYRQSATSLEAWPADQRALLSFAEITGQLKDTVCGLYARFGIALGDDFRRELEREDLKARRYESRHTYSLERFSLTQEAIESAFPPASDPVSSES